MAWTATAGKPRFDRDGIGKIEVVFSDGIQEIRRDISIQSMDDFTRLPITVAGIKRQLSDMFGAASAFVPGPISDPVAQQTKVVDDPIKTFASNVAQLTRAVDIAELLNRAQNCADPAIAALAAAVASEAPAQIPAPASIQVSVPLT